MPGGKASFARQIEAEKICSQSQIRPLRERMIAYGIFVHLNTAVLGLLAYVLTAYMDAKPIGKHTVIDSVMRDMLVTSMVRQVS